MNTVAGKVIHRHGTIDIGESYTVSSVGFEDKIRVLLTYHFGTVIVISTPNQGRNYDSHARNAIEYVIDHNLRSLARISWIYVIVAVVSKKEVRY